MGFSVTANACQTSLSFGFLNETIKFPPHLKLVATLPCEVSGTFGLD